MRANLRICHLAGQGTCPLSLGREPLVDLLLATLKAKRSVLGVPLNKLLPDCPGTTRWGEQSRIFSSVIKGARVQPSEKIRGQKGADGHLGTINVPSAPVFKVCLITLGIRTGGRQSQLFSPAQLQVKASTASEPGFQKRELNLGS